MYILKKWINLQGQKIQEIKMKQKNIIDFFRWVDMNKCPKIGMTTFFAFIYDKPYYLHDTFIHLHISVLIKYSQQKSCNFNFIKLF